MKKTLVVWRRYGKEHGEGSGFQHNTPEIIDAHLRGKIERFNNTPSHRWAWWQLAEDLIYEKPLDVEFYGPNTEIFYLPLKNWAIMKGITIKSLGEEWKWYVHIGETRFNQKYNCWIFTDHFVDVVVQKDCKTHTVLDLNDLAYVFELGVLSQEEMITILRSTQEFIDLLRNGGFPPEQLLTYAGIL